MDRRSLAVANVELELERKHSLELARECKRLRRGLLDCVRAAGGDVTEGQPTWPDIVAWAVKSVEECCAEGWDFR